MGLSERNVDTFSPETRLADLETIVDAAGIETFDLMGFSEGGTTAMAYAATRGHARSGEGTTAVILCGGNVGVEKLRAILG